MNVAESSINDFFSTQLTSFVIPVYQRNYAWKKENCEKLFDDIWGLIKMPQRKHYLGTITYIWHQDSLGQQFVIAARYFAYAFSKSIAQRGGG